MKKNMLWIAIAALIIPVLARGLWFYHGFPHQPKVAIPDYQEMTVSAPPLETPNPTADKNIKQLSGLVLFDLAHSNQYQPPEIQSVSEAIEKRGGKMESITDTTALENKLKYASAYVVISPSVAFTADETRIVHSFVERGGRLIVFADATRGIISYDLTSGAAINNPDSNAVNPLLSPYGITINNDYLYNLKKHEGNFRNIFFDSFGKNELTFGLKQVVLYGTHSVKSTAGLVLLQGNESTLSSIDDVHDAAEGGAALSENGNVLAFGDFTFLSSPYQNVADNATLIANIADFALGSKQVLSLANYPYIFKQPVVQVYPSSKVQLTAETIAAISTLQTSLSATDSSIEIVKEAPNDGDALILGTFTASDDLQRFIDPFNIDLEKSTETVTVKNLGEIGRTGTGLLLFEKTDNGNRLTLLADTQEDLISLLNTVASGSLSGCVLQDNIGVCSVGSGSSFSGDSTDTSKGTATPEPSKTEATPTAVG